MAAETEQDEELAQEEEEIMIQFAQETEVEAPETVMEDIQHTKP